MKILVGDFNELQLTAGEDKLAVEKKKKETGLEYVSTKIVKIKGETHLRIWVESIDDFKKEKLF